MIEIDITPFSNADGVDEAMQRALAHMEPPPDILPSKFAEDNIVIPIGNAVPGPIRFDAAAYQRGMIDVVVEPGIECVSYMLGAQLGKTTIQQCITAYFIAHEPRSQIWLLPTEGDMTTFRATKLQPMLDANKSIRDRMAKPRGREGQNNSRLISFIGGWLMFAWAGALTTLRGRSAPVTQADEIDGMVRVADEKKNEGDQVELLRQRAASFRATGQALHIQSSTPTIKDLSRIEKAHDQGDCRKFNIPCQHCGEHQVMQWENVTWTGRQFDEQGAPDHEADAAFEGHDPESAAYACEHCGALWTDADRKAAVRNGEWRATKPFNGHASFHLNELNSPFGYLRDIVKSYLSKVKSDSYNTFVNVSLAKTYEEKGETVDPTGLKKRAAEFAAQVPMGGCYLTAGIDMQMDRLEVEVVAWGVAEESWSVEYRVLWGDPLASEVWEDLDDLLAETYTHETGAVLPISAACLDTGGTNGMTQAAYEYLRGKTGRRLFGIKGVGGWGRPIVEKMQRKQSGKNARKVDLFVVGVDEAKLIVMRRLANEKPGPGYCHIPADRPDLDEWLKQLTAEKLMTRYVKGQPIREWWKPDRARNEALDCRAYATAALKIMQPPLRRLAERLLARAGLPIPPPPPPRTKADAPTENVAKLVKALQTVAAAAAKAPAPAAAEKPQEVAPPKRAQTQPVVKSPAARRRGGNWVTGWK